MGVCKREFNSLFWEGRGAGVEGVGVGGGGGWNPGLLWDQHFELKNYVGWEGDGGGGGGRSSYLANYCIIISTTEYVAWLSKFNLYIYEIKNCCLVYLNNTGLRLMQKMNVKDELFNSPFRTFN